MELDSLVTILIRERSKYEKVIISEVANLSFSDVVREIKFDPKDSCYENFKNGNPFNFILKQGWLRAVLFPDYMGLGSRDLEIKRFTGKEVFDYYTTLIDAIELAKADSADLPF